MFSRLWSRLPEGMHSSSQQIQSQPRCSTAGFWSEARRWSSSADWQGSLQAFWLGGIKTEGCRIRLGVSLPNVHCGNKKLAWWRSLLWLPGWNTEETNTGIHALVVLVVIAVVAVMLLLDCCWFWLLLRVQTFLHPTQRFNQQYHYIIVLHSHCRRTAVVPKPNHNSTPSG